MRCVGQRCGVSLLYSSTCNSVTGWRVMMSGKLVWSFQRGAWVLDGVGVGFYGWWVQQGFKDFIWGYGVFVI